MNISETKTGAVIVEGATGGRKFRVEWDAEGRLVSESIEIKEPASLPSTPSRAVKRAEAPETQTLPGAGVVAGERPGLVRRLVDGVVGLVKFKTGVGQAGAAVIYRRLALCDCCEHSGGGVSGGGASGGGGGRPVWERRCGRWSDVVNGKAKTCGCGLGAKAALRASRCPLGKW